jgi:hypothetical protein
MEVTKRLVSGHTSAYVKYVKSLELDLGLCQDSLLSGWLCATFMLSLALCSQPTWTCLAWEGILKRVYAYVGMYLLLDHYIDAPEITEANKVEVLELIKSGCLKPQDNALYTKLLGLRKELVSTDEDAGHLTKLIQAVIVSYEAQRQDKLSLGKYLAICKLKGGVTLVSGVHLIYKDLLPAYEDADLYNLGYCIQLFDDMIDCTADIKSGINTQCTRLVKRRKKLYSMYVLLLQETLLLPKCFAMHGFALRVALYYSVDRSKHYSSSFRKALSFYPYKYVGERKFKESIEAALRDLYL